MSPVGSFCPLDGVTVISHQPTRFKDEAIPPPTPCPDFPCEALPNMLTPISASVSLALASEGDGFPTSIPSLPSPFLVLQEHVRCPVNMCASSCFFQEGCLVVKRS